MLSTYPRGLVCNKTNDIVEETRFPNNKKMFTTIMVGLQYLIHDH